MPFYIIRNDITKVHADAIVNTANPEPIYASGTDSAIYHAAGAEKLLAERKKIGPIKPGEIAVTPAFRLHAKYIIHTVGPVWVDGEHREFELLASCYRKSLLIARQLGCRSIAFPLISTGVYGFPKDKALDIALEQFSAFLKDNGKESAESPAESEEDEMVITLVVFDRKAFHLSSALVEDVRQFIDENYVEEHHAREYSGNQSRPMERGGFWRRLMPGRAVLESPHSYRPDGAALGSPQAYRPDEAEESPQPYRPDGAALGSPQAFFLDQEMAEFETDGSVLFEESMPEPAPSYPSNAAPPDTAPADREPRKKTSPRTGSASGAFRQKPAPKKPQRSLQDIMSHVGENFQECLLRMIDERDLKDSEVYKRANIDRKLFSKIRCNPNYTPGHKTAISLAIALELNMDEMTDLLRRAGIALSPGSKYDLIIRYCVENRIYDTYKINALLFDYCEETLGAG